MYSYLHSIYTYLHSTCVLFGVISNLEMIERPWENACFATAMPFYVRLEHPCILVSTGLRSQS